MAGQLNILPRETFSIKYNEDFQSNILAKLGRNETLLRFLSSPAASSFVCRQLGSFSSFEYLTLSQSVCLFVCLFIFILRFYLLLHVCLFVCLFIFILCHYLLLHLAERSYCNVCLYYFFDNRLHFLLEVMPLQLPLISI